MDDETRYAAMHEAGHAVAAVVFGHNLKFACIYSADDRHDEGLTGRVEFDDIDCGEIRGKTSLVMPYLVALMAGPEAERLVNPHEHRIGRDDDDSRAEDLAQGLFCDLLTNDQEQFAITDEEYGRTRYERIAIINQATRDAKDFVTRYRSAIEAVADVLLGKLKLTGTEVAAIVARYPPIEA